MSDPTFKQDVIKVGTQPPAGMTNGQQKIISAGLMNDVLDGLTATEQYFGDRYSPAYIVSETQPTFQQATDFWFHVTGAATV